MYDYNDGYGSCSLFLIMLVIFMLAFGVFGITQIRGVSTFLGSLWRFVALIPPGVWGLSLIVLAVIAATIAIVANIRSGGRF